MDSIKTEITRRMAACRTEMAALIASRPDKKISFREWPDLTNGKSGKTALKQAFPVTISLRKIRTVTDMVQDMLETDDPIVRNVQRAVLVHLGLIRDILISEIRLLLLSISGKADRMPYDGSRRLACAAANLEEKTVLLRADPDRFAAYLQELENEILYVRKQATAQDFDMVYILSALNFIQKIVLSDE